MRWRIIGMASLGVNLGLAAASLYFVSHRAPSANLAGLGAGAATNSAGRTNILVRRQFFSWREVESNDYSIYVSNLREIGCPEQTIRDIIIADVNSLYARRRATELVTPEQQWWRTQPDSNVLAAAAEKVRALEEERKLMLTQLLGPNWELGDIVSLPRPSQPGIVLDGPVLGSLAAETKQALQQISSRSQERLQTYLDGRQKEGKNPDPAELARLRQLTRNELAGVLAPAQLEEFLLRYSQHANELRTQLGQLQYFQPSAEEFRAIFRATDRINEQLQLLGDATDAQSVQNRRALQEQRETAIKQAVGPARYEDYRLLHDPLYQQAVAAATEAGTPESARTFYAINLAAAAEQQSITNDTSLSAEQRAVALKALELEQLKANTLAGGQELPPEPPMPPAPPLRRTYTLRPGDTAAVVGLIYGVPESAIRSANPNVNFNRLRPGDTVTIPRSALSPITAPRGLPAGP